MLEAWWPPWNPPRGCCSTLTLKSASASHGWKVETYHRPGGVFFLPCSAPDEKKTGNLKFLWKIYKLLPWKPINNNNFVWNTPFFPVMIWSRPSGTTIWNWLFEKFQAVTLRRSLFLTNPGSQPSPERSVAKKPAMQTETEGTLPATHFLWAP